MLFTALYVFHTGQLFSMHCVKHHSNATFQLNVHNYMYKLPEVKISIFILNALYSLMQTTDFCFNLSSSQGSQSVRPS
jgi:hypothetical protein